MTFGIGSLMVRGVGWGSDDVCGRGAVCRGNSASFSFMPVAVLLPASRPLPPPAPWSGSEAHWAEWRTAMDVLGHLVHPVPVIRRWVREITVTHLVAR